MSDELESLASDYLDGESPPEKRSLFERAAITDATRAEELRSLAAIRDMVAGLPRPAAPDVSKAVLERITAPRSRIFGLPATTPPRVAAAMAAGLLVLAFGLASPHVFRRSVPAPPALVQAPVVTHPVPTAIVDEPVGVPETVGPPAVHATPPVGVAVKDRGTAALELLGRPGPHRILLISAGDGPADAAETASLLEISSHRDFFQLDTPGPADESRPSAVFVAELDPNELATLRNRLAGVFTGRIDEVEADPHLLTELASARRVTTLKADPAGEVLFPQNQMALQSPAVVASAPASQLDGGRIEAASPPVPVVAAEAAGHADDRPSIVLVWLVGPASP